MNLCLMKSRASLIVGSQCRKPTEQSVYFASAAEVGVPVFRSGNHSNLTLALDMPGLQDCLNYYNTRSWTYS